MNSKQDSRQGPRDKRTFTPAQNLLATGAHTNKLRSPIPLLEATS